MSRPRLLDLFCGAGGAAVGYHRAGFDIVGVDTEPQPRYPFDFVQADAMTYPTRGFDAVHASPPCQPYSKLATLCPDAVVNHPALIPDVRAKLRRTRLPYVIENVPGAPMREPLTLCGTEFGLCIRTVRDGQRRWLKRHRLFESNVDLPAAAGCRCVGVLIAGVYGHGGGDVRFRGWQCSASDARSLLGIGWMNRNELAQAIPPAYTEYVGRWLLAAVHDGGISASTVSDTTRRMMRTGSAD